MSGATARSQTLARGIGILEILADAQRPLTVGELAELSRLHRSIVYRLVRTLEDHRLVARTDGEAYRLGFGLAALARGITREVCALAMPCLQDLADRTGMSAFIAVREGDDAVTIVVATPAAAEGMFVHMIGHRHSVMIGAPGHALRLLDPAPDPRAPGAARLEAFRARGWTTSLDEVLRGVGGVAAPLPGAPAPMAVAVTYVGEPDVAAVGAAVVATRDAILDRM